MPHSCSALNCKNRNRSSGSITFHSFPLENADLLKKWVSRMARGSWKPSKFSMLCSEHFEAKCFVEVNGRTVLKPNVLPSVFSDPSYVQRRVRKKRLKRGRPRKVVSVNRKQSKPSDSTTEEPMRDNGSSEDKDPAPDNDSHPEDSLADVNGSQDASEYDSDRTTSDVDSGEPISMLQGKLHAAKLEIKRLQESITKWESLNEALKPENRDPFLIDRLNVIQKDAAQGHANSIMLLNSIILYGKDPEETA